MQLLIFLLKLERQGIRYHLVGHSHGGSVSLADGGTLRRHRIVRSLMNWGVCTSLLGGGLGLSSFLAVTYRVFILWPYLASFLLAGFFFAQAERIDLANSLTLRERAWQPGPIRNGSRKTIPRHSVT
ncbi:hypothetical protein V2J94_17475 [Streptomyces sp. DSM 41524]|uniref:Uncharacterized protein n=1 Tax=Streptomyces asiaticus subsp. ignotus TaxID=3098222 RepID=A0ABU7PX22_9ACTN|nr:hypothetical protein [Streptomyces sp. DSM 41524]